MKKISTLLVVCILFLGYVSCEKNINPELLAYYSFNGDASDQSGNNNHGVVHGGHLTKDRFGNANNAYKFDGSSAYIIALVSNMPAVDDPQTICFWFMVDQTPVFGDSYGAGNIFVLADSTQGVGIQLGYRASGYNTLGYDTWFWGGRTILESQHPAINEWHHIAYSFDGEEHLFYIDGRQTAQSFVKPQKGTPHMLMFGNYPGGNQFFKGCLDDVKIYKGTLSNTAINDLYKNRE